MTKIIRKKYLIIILLSIFILAVCSKNVQAGQNPENMLQNDVMIYSLDTSIEEIHIDFIERQFKEIKIRDDYISANVNFFGLSSDFYFGFFNGEMFRGGISYLGFPGESEGDDEYTLDGIFRIKETIESEKLSEGETVSGKPMAKGNRHSQTA